MLREEQHPRPLPGGAGRPVGRRPLSAAVNPYVQWVHEHPAVLLAEPTPALLQAGLSQCAGPVVLDLGCGSGNYLLERARRAPQGRFVGFELRFKRLVKAARKMERAGLHNVWLLREQGERCADYFAPGSLRAVHVNFPDPWPRRSDWRKRLVSASLLRTLARLLEPGGQFILKTDHSGYFLHALSLLPAAPELRVAGFSNGHTEAPGAQEDARTEFELMFRGQRKPVYRLVLERVAGAGRA